MGAVADAAAGAARAPGRGLGHGDRRRCGRRLEHRDAAEHLQPAAPPAVATGAGRSRDPLAGVLLLATIGVAQWHLKRGFGLRRTRLRRLGGARTWVGLGIFAYNLQRMTVVAA
jgi:hypothetical protein